MSATARWVSAVAMVWTLAACSSLGGPRDALDYDPPTDAGQPEFTAPGCPDQDGPMCPRSATAYCAVELAGQGQMFCTEDYDCELVWLKPRCLSICEPVAVEFEGLITAKAAKQAEIDRYCSMGPCSEAPCADAGGVWFAACVNNFCAALQPTDAGHDAGVDLDAGDVLDAGLDPDAEIPDA